MENDPGVKGPYLLEIDDYHLTDKQGQKVVKEMLSESGVKSPPGGWNSFIYKYEEYGLKKKMTFRKLVVEAMEKGYVRTIQKFIDERDSVFGGLEHVTSPTPGVESEYTFNGMTMTLNSPSLLLSSAYSLSEDILFYREEACYESENYDFIDCARNYRSYLSSCISLIDVFINKYILYYKYTNLHTDQLEEIQKSSRLEDKIAKLVNISTKEGMSAIKGGVEWKHFKSIKDLRNEMVHINAPSMAYSIIDFPDHFNYAREGVGGLLGLIRKLQGKKTLGFIERIKTAPWVKFNQESIKNSPFVTSKKR